MKTLRAIHLCSGCLFAPLLLVFAISGIWQRLAPVMGAHLPPQFTRPAAFLSTFHTGRSLKLGGTLSSDVMTGLVIAMSLSLILTIVLGVMMAFRFGHRRMAVACLAAGVLVPAAVCVVTFVPQKTAHPTSMHETAPAEKSTEGPAGRGESKKD